MAIIRITALWTGFTGAPGYTNLFFDAFGGGDIVDAEYDRAIQFFGALTSILPEDVSIQVQQEAAIIEETTGELLDYRQATDPAGAWTGDATGGYSAPSGASITWNTSGIARGRRLRGRTFIVPLANSAYEDNGTLTSGAINSMTNAGNQLLDSSEGATAVIWSRPRGGSGGVAFPINGFRVADKAAVLRSRRD